MWKHINFKKENQRFSQEHWENYSNKETKLVSDSLSYAEIGETGQKLTRLIKYILIFEIRKSCSKIS